MPVSQHVLGEIWSFTAADDDDDGDDDDDDDDDDAGGNDDGGDDNGEVNTLSCDGALA